MITPRDKKRPLKRSFLNAFAFHSEAHGPWRLRELQIRNAEMDKFRRGKRAGRDAISIYGQNQHFVFC